MADISFSCPFFNCLK